VPYENLCLAGGVGLNCVANEVVQKSGEFANLFIPSAPHDAGTAVGAAFAIHAETQKKPPQRGYSTPYLGPSYNKREIQAAIIRHDLPLYSRDRVPLMTTLLGANDDVVTTDRTHDWVECGEWIRELRPHIDLYLLTDESIAAENEDELDVYDRTFYRLNDVTDLYSTVLAGIRSPIVKINSTLLIEVLLIWMPNRPSGSSRGIRIRSFRCCR